VAASVFDAPLAALDPLTLYAILMLRVNVFVVEQECPYPELDGRDAEPSTVHVWAEQDEHVLATLRLLREADGSARIGRVATAAAARGQGLAALLVARALELAGPVPVTLEAQSHLADWYARFGFVRHGRDYVEDGIPHTPMRRAAPA